MTRARLELARAQVLGWRRTANALDRRLPPGPDSLRHAAWAGLQDSMPRAALLSIHARVTDTAPDALEDPALAQVWGPRFSAFVVASVDVPVFTLGRFPDDARGRRVALETAERLRDFLAGRRMGYGDADEAMGVNPNSLRYATTTGTVRMRWEGAGQPVIWTVPAPAMTADEARVELARRHLRVYGPATPDGLARWAGIGPREARAAFDGLGGSLTAVRTSIGDGWILADDEAAFRAPAAPATGARLLPSGDAYTLLHGADRELLVPGADRRALLWTPRVWPGAVPLDGEVVGTWRRAEADLTIAPWRRLSAAERRSIEAEAASLPLPNVRRSIAVRWEI